jgi:hypothetical protein
MENRRRAPRHPAGWRGVCHVEGEPATGWRDCEVIDISALGMAMELHHFWPSELVGRRITVDLPAHGTSINMMLEGEIRNIRQMPGAVVQLGIEFIGLSKEELSIINVLALASLSSSRAS